MYFVENSKAAPAPFGELLGYTNFPNNKGVLMNRGSELRIKNQVMKGVSGV